MTKLLTFLLLLGLSISCSFAQTEDDFSNLNSTFFQLVPFCEQQQGSNETEPLDDICSNPEKGLKCKTLLDEESDRQILALVHENGIAFWEISEESGNATLVAKYEDQCARSLYIIGKWRNWILFSSEGQEEGNATQEECEPLGIASISFSDLESDGNATDEGQTRTVNATTNTSMFSSAQFILMKDKKGEQAESRSDRILVVWNAQNETGEDSGASLDMILEIQEAEELSFEVLFSQESFPFNLYANRSVLFSAEGEEEEVYIAGPASEQGSAPWDSVEIWALFGEGNQTEEGNATQGAEPSEVSSIPMQGVKFVEVSADAQALYIGSEGESNQTQEGEQESDMLSFVDISDPENPEIMLNFTYQQLKESLGEEEGNVTQTESAQITALKTSSDKLWTGWSTGEVFVHDISNPLEPSLLGFVNIYELEEVDQAGIEQQQGGNQGIADICPVETDNQEAKSFVLAWTRDGEEGKLFIGLSESDQ